MNKKVKIAANKFWELYSPVIEAANNHLAVGFGKDKLGNYTIAARLTNENCKDILPTTFEGFKVETLVIGVIVPLEEKE